MTKPITVPNTFATATTTIPLSQLDSNFTTVSNSINDANTYSNYAADTGIANAYVVTFSSLTTTYAAGLRIQFKATNGNTGASTINVNGQGVKNITYANGTSLAPGTIVAGAIVDIIYDGTQFLLLSPAGYINVPQVPKSSGYTLTRTEVGKYVEFTNGSPTIPDGVFYSGDVVGLVNNTSGNMQITCSITTAYLSGTNTDQSVLYILPRGLATVLFLSSTACVISGAVTQ
jgi:hypothetical protein